MPVVCQEFVRSRSEVCQESDCDQIWRAESNRQRSVSWSLLGVNQESVRTIFGRVIPTKFGELI